MSEEGNIPAGGSADGQNGTDEANAPAIRVVSQYIKDLSFENPAAPLTNVASRPQVELNVDLKAKQADKELFEVEMKLQVSAKIEDKPAFLLELVYGGLFFLHNIPEDVRSQILMIEAPHLLFPFVRRIVADVVQDGGLPSLMIEPIDFAALYRAKMAEMQQRNVAPGHLDA
ncbi:MAG: protein-export chaperone SecB [Rhizomicrobium sp.]